MPLAGYVAVFPGLILGGLMLGALGLVLSSFIRQLENLVKRAVLLSTEQRIETALIEDILADLEHGFSAAS